MHTGIVGIEPRIDGMKVIRDTHRITEEYPDYLRDESNVHARAVRALFFPRSNEHVSWILREARRKSVPVTVSGGRTGICAGSVPESGGYVVSLEKMNRVLALEQSGDEFLLSAECGLRLSELSTRLKSRDLGVDGAGRLSASNNSYFYPPDPTETSATLGGTVATNASGARTFFYGPTRDYVAGVEVVLPAGELLRVRRGEVFAEGGFFRVPRERGEPLLIPAPDYAMPKTKNSAGLFSAPGMDLIDLFVGSEGILGVIAAVTVRLIHEPAGFGAGVVFLQDEEGALAFVERARAGGPRPLALEYFDADALRLLDRVRGAQGPTSEIPEMPAFGAAVYFESAVGTGGNDGYGRIFRGWRTLIRECGGDPSAAWGAMDKRDLLRLKIFRHTVPEQVNMLIAQRKRKNPAVHKVGTDMAVPDGALREIVGFYRSQLERERLRTVIFGHIGNNHLHVNIIPDSEEELARARDLYKTFAVKAVSLGGSVSAEHGIGKLKKEYLGIQYSEEDIEQMRAIKRAVDPAAILNPGDMV